ncbi:MAG TPA: pyridoxal-phosphate dependent enzyme [Candidatus Hydrogenedentes bacterium]|nr:pyridoxal-phosphate dependent enzyme [Candidatus Hydrogenedentota bacterium]HPG65808.1 pyridoxal-phosphate dependent enzyme [Candidatus Hydrogenedentota bacterium]
MFPLFDRYPGLKAGLPWTPLGSYPTPVQEMTGIRAALGGALGQGRLFVKRDDLSGTPYGGNKVRNLEFLLGKALHRGKRTLVAFGTAGSNQVVATAIYGRQLGLDTIGMVLPQANARLVQRNLLTDCVKNADLHYHGGPIRVAADTIRQLIAYRLRTGQFPELTPPGGTSPTGIAGFVNAAFELKTQIDAGEIPEPDWIYAPMGTIGTVIGLLLGVKAAGLRTKVMAVRIVPKNVCPMRKARRMFRQTSALLHSHDSNFPLLTFPEADFRVRHDFFGEEYALYTEESVAAVRRVKELEGLRLEGTYTGKAFAALWHDAQSGHLKNQNVLFWITCNSHDMEAAIQGVDYHNLPKPLHQFFEEDVQPLDR